MLRNGCSRLPCDANRRRPCPGPSPAGRGARARRDDIAGLPAVARRRTRRRVRPRSGPADGPRLAGGAPGSCRRRRSGGGVGDRAGRAGVTAAGVMLTADCWAIVGSAERRRAAVVGRHGQRDAGAEGAADGTSAAPALSLVPLRAEPAAVLAAVPAAVLALLSARATGPDQGGAEAAGGDHGDRGGDAPRGCGSAGDRRRSRTAARSPPRPARGPDRRPGPAGAGAAVRPGPGGAAGAPPGRPGRRPAGRPPRPASPASAAPAARPGRRRARQHARALRGRRQVVPDPLRRRSVQRARPCRSASGVEIGVRRWWRGRLGRSVVGSHRASSRAGRTPVRRAPGRPGSAGGRAAAAAAGPGPGRSGDFTVPRRTPRISAVSATE